MKKLWFDFTNVPHVHFLEPIIRRYHEKFQIIVSARDYAETVELLRNLISIQPIVIGKHGGVSMFKKIYRLFARLIRLSRNVPYFEYAISCGGIEACILAKWRRRVSIVFDDNDISPNWLYSRFADHSIFPDAIPPTVLGKQGFRPCALFQYKGYKEDIYIADYEPDRSFLGGIPFRDYVVLRPENKLANYVDSTVVSIIPQLLNTLSRAGFKTLYLPRTAGERTYAYGLDGVFIPRTTVNGLDAIFFSRAVISGAGSLTREAACLGRPAISCYPGDQLLAVDNKMIRDGWLIHSRNTDEIVEYINSAKSRRFDRHRSKKVQDSVFKKLDAIILE